MKKNRFFFGAFAYFLFLSCLSHVPGSELEILPLNIWDKLAHGALYLPLGVLLALGSVCHGLVAQRWLTVLLVTLIVFTLGGLDEYHQSTVPGRYATVGDALADAVGGFFGAVAGLAMARVVFKSAEQEKEEGTIRSPS